MAASERPHSRYFRYPVQAKYRFILWPLLAAKRLTSQRITSNLAG